MEQYLSKVVLVGKVKEINLETRDVVMTSATPKGKEVACTVHFWKTSEDNASEAVFHDRAPWKNILEVGKTFIVAGHLGNSGRVIATGFQPVVFDGDQIVEAEVVVNA